MSDDLDPSEFVQRIRQLGEQRDQQDAERVKKLEEELIQGRSERLARRAGALNHSGGRGRGGGSHGRGGGGGGVGVC